VHTARQRSALAHSKVEVVWRLTPKDCDTGYLLAKFERAIGYGLNTGQEA